MGCSTLTETTQASPARRAQTASRDPMVIMTNQVKEVLPHVPAAAIVKDLSKLTLSPKCSSKV